MRLEWHEQAVDRILWVLDEEYARSLGIDLSDRRTLWDVPPANYTDDEELAALNRLWNRTVETA